jgi:thiol-disulfide isomerase/thioredoxin
MSMTNKLIRWGVLAIGALLGTMALILGMAVWVASLQVNGQGLPACCRLPAQDGASAAANGGVGRTLSHQDLATGEIRQLSDLPTFVVFFATWCPSCIEEAPALAQLAGEGAPVLLLNATDSFEEAGDWVRVYAPTLTAGVLVKEQRALNSLAVVSLPTILLLDEKGREVERWRGPTELSVLRKAWQDIQNAE